MKATNGIRTHAGRDRGSGYPKMSVGFTYISSLDQINSLLK